MSTSAPRAFSYIRFSTPDQLKGDSLRRQLELSARYAKEHGLELDDKLTFRDLGVSAFDKSNLSVRGDLRAFLDAVKQGLIPAGSFLLVESLDRLSRAQIHEALKVFLDIVGEGITIVTLSDGMRYCGQSNDPNKDFMSLVVSLAIMSRAHEESLTKSRRLKAAWEQKRRLIHKRKLTSQCPAWLKLGEDRAAYEFIPEHVALVRQIIDLIRSGQGKTAIAKRLNEGGIPSFGGRSKGGSWFESYITKIIKSRALIGEFQPMKVAGSKRVPVGEPISGYFPRVLSDEEFALLQDLISERGCKAGGNRGHGFSNLFTGVVRCGYCDGTMVYVDKGEDKRRKGPSTKNRFLVCGSAKRGLGCHYVPWTYADFEEAFFRFAAKIDFERFVSMGDSNKQQQRHRLNEQLIILRAKQAELRLKRDRLVDAIAGAEAEPKGVIDRLLAIEGELTECEQRFQAAEVEQQQLDSQTQMSEQAIEALRQVAADLSRLQADDRFLYRSRLNEYLRRVLAKIILFPGGTIHTPAQIAHLKAELSSSGRYTMADIEDYVERFLPTEPMKHERYFAIRNREQIVQVISPESRVPDIFAYFEGKQDLWADAVRRARERVRVSLTT